MQTIVRLQQSIGNRLSFDPISIKLCLSLFLPRPCGTLPAGTLNGSISHFPFFSFFRGSVFNLATHKSRKYILSIVKEKAQEKDAV